MVQDAEKVLQLLNLPYRVVLLSSGDMGFAASKCYDLEVWLPGFNTYREISSCSNFEDFQARRANIRFRRAGGQTRVCAYVEWFWIGDRPDGAAILENYQQADGSVVIGSSSAIWAEDSN